MATRGQQVTSISGYARLATTPNECSQRFAPSAAPLFGLSVDDLVNEQTVFQIGVAPVRIDIVSGIDGVAFEEAWSRRVSASLGACEVSVLSLIDLAANKRAAGRPKDLADLVWIEQEIKREPPR